MAGESPALARAIEGGLQRGGERISLWEMRKRLAEFVPMEYAWNVEEGKGEGMDDDDESGG